MTREQYSDQYISGILSRARSIAMVGASANDSRPSYFALKYLLGKGYIVHPINPRIAGETLLGQTVYGSLEDVPGPVDIVDVFRGADAAVGIVQDALSHRERLGIKVIWLQLGVYSPEAAALAREAGLQVVMNRCPKIEYGRLSGEIGWVGVNSRVITSARRQLSPHGVQNHLIDAVA